MLYSELSTAALSLPAKGTTCGSTVHKQQISDFRDVAYFMYCIKIETNSFCSIISDVACLRNNSLLVVLYSTTKTIFCCKMDVFESPPKENEQRRKSVRERNLLYVQRCHPTVHPCANSKICALLTYTHFYINVPDRTTKYVV